MNIRNMIFLVEKDDTLDNDDTLSANDDRVGGGRSLLSFVSMKTLLMR
jgi:hypothetical protein